MTMESQGCGLSFFPPLFCLYLSARLAPLYALCVPAETERRLAWELQLLDAEKDVTDTLQQRQVLQVKAHA